MRITFRATPLLIVSVALFGGALIESQRSIAQAAPGRPSEHDTQTKADGSRSVWDGVYTEEQAKRGNPLYQQECANCHGSQLNGGEAAPERRSADGEHAHDAGGQEHGDEHDEGAVAVEGEAEEDEAARCPEDHHDYARIINAP